MLNVRGVGRQSMRQDGMAFVKVLAISVLSHLYDSPSS